MQKIGLVSYHYFRNYGTCLQAFALQYVISVKYKKDCEYIDFGQSEYPGMFPHITWMGKIKICIRKLINLKYTISDNKSTEAFLNFKKTQMKISRKYRIEELNNIESIYNKVIVGSDQTWSPKAISKVYYPLMMLSFMTDKEKKYSYAPSLGGKITDEDTMELLKTQLSTFNMISTREKQSQTFLANLLDRDISFVLDPTLLLSSVEWNKITCNIKNKYQDYVLCYQIGSRDVLYGFARKLAKRNNLKLLAVTISQKLKKRADIYPSGIGPFEFVLLIKNASYVVTDSFHGTAFCVNFNKHFFSFYKQEGGRSVLDNNRIYDFLKLFELTGRIVDEEEFSFEPINYGKVNHILEQERIHSYSYLNRIITD